MWIRSRTCARTSSRAPNGSTDWVSIPPPQKALATLVRGVLLLSFLLICLLFLVGFLAMVREWMRDASAPRRRWWRRRPTAYVDAWRLAGQRMKVDGDAPESPGPPPKL